MQASSAASDSAAGEQFPDPLADGLGGRVDGAGAAHRLARYAEDPVGPDGRVLELLLGGQFLAAQHHVVGELGQLGHGDLLTGADPGLVRLDRVAER